MVTSLNPATTHAIALYQRHGKVIRAYLDARLRDGAADDLCQETFLAALDQGVPSDDPAVVGRWLFGIARKKVLKHYRDRKPVSGIDPTATSEGPGPEDLAGQQEEQAIVRGAVGALPEELREVILLRYEGGLRYPEIAALLDLPLSTVQGRLNRARVTLKKQLSSRERA